MLMRFLPCLCLLFLSQASLAQKLGPSQPDVPSVRDADRTIQNYDQTLRDADRRIQNYDQTLRDADLMIQEYDQTLRDADRTIRNYCNCR
jgi:hypothetical protein